MLDKKRELEGRIGSGLPVPSKKPKQLPLSEIRVEPSVFQHRQPQRWGSRYLLSELAKALKDGNPLDPLTVFWTGDGWTCLDGHHRLDAYRVADWKQKVPVRVFEGTLDDAMGEALALNSRARLSMSTQERMRAAWRLTVSTSLSKASVAAAACASKAQVAYMRKVARTLRDIGRSEGELAEMEWTAARRAAEGRSSPEVDYDEDEKVRAALSSLVKEFGSPIPNHMRVILAKALREYDAPVCEIIAEDKDGDEFDYQDDEEEEEHGYY